nr:uncharacterized protein SPAC4H3.12c [Schizosaccharomyces pombe]Q10219.1 RecName: Full=Putative uncharacterized protein SPAC4H3.12c [Schizosaccharomyces pombe 972h-]CAA93351.1 dubious [Schizosaccharomyces pombe]|eukprot:NP_594348.1 uncharacterized protein SPAC4H3.12c [Schizosaccharomyces pombe]
MIVSNRNYSHKNFNVTNNNFQVSCFNPILLKIILFLNTIVCIFYVYKIALCNEYIRFLAKCFLYILRCMSTVSLLSSAHKMNCCNFYSNYNILLVSSLFFF